MKDLLVSLYYSLIYPHLIYGNIVWGNNYKTRLFSSFTESSKLLFQKLEILNPFAPGDFAEKRVLKLVEWFSGHCRAIKS